MVVPAQPLTDFRIFEENKTINLPSEKVFLKEVLLLSPNFFHFEPKWKKIYNPIYLRGFSSVFNANTLRFLHFV